MSQQTASARQTIETLADRFRDQSRILNEQARSGLLRLACAVAARVVRQVAQKDLTLVRHTLEQGIDLAAAHGQVTVRVHPLDAQTVRQFLPEVVRTVEGLGEWAVQADESVGRGGCVIRTLRGELDARLETQLDRIERELLHEARDGAPAVQKRGTSA